MNEDQIADWYLAFIEKYNVIQTVGEHATLRRYGLFETFVFRCE